MPKLIRDGAIVEDAWREADEDLRTPGPDQIATLDQWLQLEDKAGSAVQLEPGQAPTPLVEHLLSLIHISEPTRLGLLSRMPSSA